MTARHQTLQRLLDAYVRSASGTKQRGADWYASMGTTVGGSEVAALLGLNPYSGFYDVVRSKLAILDGRSDWGGGGPPCWWGVLFEDVIALYVAADLGAPILGDDICVQKMPGHRNSPDGFIVARFTLQAAAPALAAQAQAPVPEAKLWTTDMPAADTESEIVLLEFKCPYSRAPTKSPTVPKQYRPQLWSGLMVTPVARRGLFVDAVFRKCALADLADTPMYDTVYHTAKTNETNLLPVAWGVIHVYAPEDKAPREVRWSSGADGAAAAAGFGGAVLDLGAAAVDVFNNALRLIDSGAFRVERGAPHFVDGRFGDYVAATPAAPEHHRLVGVIPWKLFRVHYVFVERHPDFAAEVMPRITEVHRLVAEARATADPLAFVAAHQQNAWQATYEPSTEDQGVFDLASAPAVPSGPAP